MTFEEMKQYVEYARKAKIGYFKIPELEFTLTPESYQKDDQQVSELASEVTENIREEYTGSRKAQGEEEQDFYQKVLGNFE